MKYSQGNCREVFKQLKVQIEYQCYILYRKLLRYMHVSVIMIFLFSLNTSWKKQEGFKDIEILMREKERIKKYFY